MAPSSTAPLPSATSAPSATPSPAAPPARVASSGAPASPVTPPTPSPSPVLSAPDQPDLLQPHVIEHGPRDKNAIALTFDADMTPGMQHQLHTGVVASWYNHDVIRVLEKHNAKATLFVTGLWAETYPHEARALAHHPLFEIANHSQNHYAFTESCYGLPSLPDDQAAADIHASQQTIFQTTGKTPELFRFPGLCLDAYDAAMVASSGLRIVQGDVTADDGFNHDTYAIVEKVTTHVQNGSIIVMHMHGGNNAPKTAEALELLIPELQKTYSLVTVSELLDEH